MLASVDLRKPTPDPSRPGPVPGAPDAVDPNAPVSWRVDGRLTVAKCTGAVIFLLAAAIGYPDPGQVLVVGLAALLLAWLAVRDLVAPVRLAADPAGVSVITGFAGRRRLAWGEIERIRVDARRGFLLRSQVLELDAGENLYFFSANELGAPCDEVAGRLEVMRAHALGAGGS